jgi:hypothetical protein
MSVSIEGPLLGQSALCEPILRSLPDWFGIEESTAQYIRDIEGMQGLDMFNAYDSSQKSEQPIAASDIAVWGWRVHFKR